MAGPDLTGDERCEVIESLCVNCQRNGTTRLLVTNIPGFHQVVVMSFDCEHCGYCNNELQPADSIQPKGIRFEVKCDSHDDLNRQVVKSDYAEIKIPELEFEVTRQPGLVTTIEGLIERAIHGLTHSIKSNVDQPDTVIKLTEFIANLRKLKSLEMPFTLIVSDPSGNSFIENPNSVQTDSKLKKTHFKRSREENQILGLFEEDQEPPNVLPEDLRNEVLQFRTSCYSCGAPCFTNMKLTPIPNFKEVIIMATNCEACGYKTNEIKSGQGIEEKGVKITVPIKTPEDLKRDVVRSDNCSLYIPELDLDAGRADAGRFTTVEGLFTSILEGLEKSCPFIFGDSTPSDRKAKIDTILERLKNPIGLTIVLDDPCGNSFVYGATDKTFYDRSFDQNEELGLNDMKTDL
ncbi:zinc finger protein Zpr1 [Brevipalpus obovatus]|uniref:zinc finger protein Zpr1 n=1 Tax=Brevipalpus obovatus TaxID=246614 RepID=UPI003D9EB666